MKRQDTGLSLLSLALAIATLAGCGERMNQSEEIYDKDAGMNGSFEYTESGLPVNWIVFTPKTVPTGDFELIIDTTEFIDGKQSLKFLVRECSSLGEHHSPGFCKEYKAIPGKTYPVSFWTKNDGCEFLVKIGSIYGFTNSEAKYETIVRSKETIDEWRLFEYDFKVLQNSKRIRFAVSVLSPGSFWIDDIKIVGIEMF